MHSFRFNYDPLATWGYSSSPLESAQQIHLDSELANVPQNGAVIDVGAGAGLSLAASVHVQRPDIDITSIDPGFALVGNDSDPLESDLEGTIGFFDDRQQEVLRASRAWRNKLLAGLGEELPVPSSSADLVVSYSAVPYYSHDKRAVLAETARVLRIGGLALHGPIPEEDFIEWDTLARNAVETGEITEYSSRPETIRTTYGFDMDVYFTRIVR